MKYPTMKAIEIKPGRGSGAQPHITIDATVRVDTGRPCVAWSVGVNADDMLLTPTEAERFARALLKAAQVARAKVAHTALMRVARRK